MLERLHQGPLTQLQAYSEIGTTRLAARVEELRRAGHVINTAMVCTRNGKSFAAYSLVKEKS